MLEVLTAVWDLVERWTMLVLKILAVAWGLLVSYALFSTLIGDYLERRKRRGSSR